MFQKARIKLTAWYLVIIMVISVSFSGVIYRVLSGEIFRFERLQRFRLERRLEGGIDLPFTQKFRQSLPPLDPDLIEETQRRLGLSLLVTNGFILVVSGGLGYFLAGRTLTPIREMVEEQNRFISDASHELRTPLTSLKTAMEVYLRGKDKKISEANALIKESVHDVDELQSLSESLLQLTQYEKPNGNLKFEKLLLQELLSDAIKRVETNATSKQIKITFNHQDATIRGVRIAITDLFVILLDNAIKYSNPGKKVDLSSKVSDGKVVITIKDHGSGIDEKDLPYVFDRFFRADSARMKKDAGGYGLGLSIAKKIVSLHKGLITAESRIGIGSEFKVTLPLS